MARPKKQVKAKEPVRLRFKQLNNGNKSIYLDIYKDGKREYEFLKMYLVPERDAVAKNQNESVMAAANAIKAQRVIELSNNAAGIKVDKARAKMLLRDWLEVYHKKTESSITPGTRGLRKCLKKHLGNYGDLVPLRDVDKAYCLGFVEYLKNTPGKTPKGTERPHSKATICTYWKFLSALLNAAVREDLIAVNPIYKIDPSERPQPEESNRAFLTIEEVKKLIETPAPRADIKRAFLFSCFCGLRISDVSALTWKNLESNNGKLYINTVMQKTKKPIYIPVSNTAAGFIPDRTPATPDSAKIFFKSRPIGRILKKTLEDWTKAAGITKKVTYHVSRHTFATMSLTLGADLFTTSKLLGHTNVTTTQIYAKIINEKKDDAVALFDNVF